MSSPTGCSRCSGRSPRRSNRRPMTRRPDRDHPRDRRDPRPDCLARRRGRLRHRPQPDELAGHRPQRQPAVSGRDGDRDRRDGDPHPRPAGERHPGRRCRLGHHRAGRRGRRRSRPVHRAQREDDGAAALIAIDDYLGLAAGSAVRIDTHIFIVLDIIIGSITFAGSIIASGKLQGLIPGKPIYVPGGQLVTLALAAITVIAALALFVSGTPNLLLMVVILAAALTFGVTMTLPIGGADMPVVISLLNSFTGTAVAMAGFVINNPVLIIAGALVGASGAILTKLMADAMNRSVLNIMIGGFGGGDEAAGAVAGASGSVRAIGPDDVAIQLAYAQHVIVVPGYGLAVAQAQHAVRELAELLEERGVDVKYAIHPVAGRMPGHMNVLLAEANVPYPQLMEMDDINPEFARADVALVIGANDVTNPAARRPGSPVSGMPILDVDQAKSIVVIKRSMGKGYAGIDNELYTNEKTGMLFADAKEGLAALTAAVKAL